MQRILFLGLIMLGISFGACDKPMELPSCIQNVLPPDGNYVHEDFANDPLPPRDIVEVYRFEDGKDLYYEVVLGCCDHFTELYNEACELVCYPRGGFSGGGAGDCPDWVESLGEGELIWQKQ